MHKYVFLIIGTVWTQTILYKLVLKKRKLTKESPINELEFSGNCGCINKICISHIKYRFIEKNKTILLIGVKQQKIIGDSIRIGLTTPKKQYVETFPNCD